MKTNILFLCLLIFSACSQNALITDENISDFQNISNAILNDDAIEMLIRDLGDVSKIYAKNQKGEMIPACDLYHDFFRNNSKICFIYKDYEDSKKLNAMLKMTDSAYYVKSEGVKKMEHGAELLLEKLSRENDRISIICFSEYTYVPFLGNTQKGNRYVYSPDLDLSSLSSEELYFLGFTYAHETKFNNWFYTAPLG